jgi:hypothetical protein
MSITTEIEELTATRFTAEHLAKRFGSITELPAEKQHGEEVFCINMDNLPAAFWGKAGDFIAAVEKAGMLTGKEYGGHKAWLPLTPEQKAHRLDEANHEWDKKADKYDAALVTRTRPGDWSDRYAIESYCNRRGLSFPWDGEDN